jgi:diguanylate cyclase
MRLRKEAPFDAGRRKRGIYLFLLVLGGIGATTSLVQNLLSAGGTLSVTVATLGTLVVSAGAAALTAYGRVPLPLLERGLLATATLLFCASVWYGLYLAPPGGPHVGGVMALMLWVPLLFVFSAIAFDGITSLRYSMAIYILVVALTLPHAVATMGGAAVSDGFFFPVQAYLAYAVIIAALYFFSDLQQRAHTMEETARTMRRLANTDALTALANRRQAEEQLLRELRRAERYGRVFSVLMMDIDHFKDLNDRFGHLAGDEVLVDLARRVERTVRSSDTIARWGGEEFILLAPETGLDDARRLAEMIRHHIDANVLADRYHVTISLGVASYRAGDSVQSVIARADAALYLAKRAGRNQVRVEIAPAPAS